MTEQSKIIRIGNKEGKNFEHITMRYADFHYDENSEESYVEYSKKHSGQLVIISSNTNELQATTALNYDFIKTIIPETERKKVKKIDTISDMVVKNNLYYMVRILLMSYFIRNNKVAIPKELLSFYLNKYQLEFLDFLTRSKEEFWGTLSRVSENSFKDLYEKLKSDYKMFRAKYKCSGIATLESYLGCEEEDIAFKNGKLKNNIQKQIFDPKTGKFKLQYSRKYMLENLKSLFESYSLDHDVVPKDNNSYGFSSDFCKQFNDPYALCYIVGVANSNLQSFVSSGLQKDITLDIAKEQKELIKLEDLIYRYNFLNCSYSKFKEICEEIDKNNREILNKQEITEELDANILKILSTWNYFKKLEFNTKDNLFINYSAVFKGIRQTYWQCLDRKICESYNLYFIQTQNSDLKELEKLEKILNYRFEYLLHDKIKDKYIAIIKLEEKPYKQFLECLQEIINTYELDLDCLYLYRGGSEDPNMIEPACYGAEIVNRNDMSIVSKQASDFIFNKLDPLKLKSGSAFEYITNIFKYAKPESLIDLTIPYNADIHWSINPQRDQRKRLTVKFDEKGNIVPDKAQTYNRNDFLLGVDLLPYLDAIYVGKKLNKKFKIYEKINKKLKKQNKALIKTIPNVLQHLITANFLKAFTDLTIWHYNNLTKDENTIRAKQQQLYMSPEMRAILVNNSIKEYLNHSSTNVWKSEENFLDIIKCLTKEETNTAIYRTIAEVIGLDPVIYSGDRTSNINCCMSFETNINKINSIWKSIKNVQTRLYNDIVKPEVLKKWYLSKTQNFIDFKLGRSTFKNYMYETNNTKFNSEKYSETQKELMLVIREYCQITLDIKLAINKLVRKLKKIGCLYKVTNYEPTSEIKNDSPPPIFIEVCPWDTSQQILHYIS